MITNFKEETRHFILFYYLFVKKIFLDNIPTELAMPKYK